MSILCETDTGHLFTKSHEKEENNEIPVSIP